MALLSTILTGVTAGASFRRIGSYTGPCCRVLRDSDSASQDFGFDSSGVIDTAALEAWLGSAHGYLTRWYLQDSSGAYFECTGPRLAVAGVVQVDDDDRPILTTDGIDDVIALRGLSLHAHVSVHLLCQVPSDVGGHLFSHQGEFNLLRVQNFESWMWLCQVQRSPDDAYNYEEPSLYSTAPQVISVINNGVTLTSYTGTILHSQGASDSVPNSVATGDFFVGSLFNDVELLPVNITEIVVCDNQDNTAALADIVSNLLGDWPPVAGAGSATESFSDNVSVADAVSASVDTAKADASTVSDSVAGSVGVTVANVSTVSDLLSIAAGAGKNDLLSASETVSVASAVSKVDAATVGDTLSVSGSSAPADIGSVTDTVSFGASVSHLDTVGVTDIFAPPGAAENSDVSTISDSVVLAAGVEVRDALTAIDSISASVSGSRIEGSSVTDTILAQIQSAYTDAAGIVDAIAFAVSAVFSEIFHISGIASAPESGATYVSLCRVQATEYIAIDMTIAEYIKTSIIVEPSC